MLHSLRRRLLVSLTIADSGNTKIEDSHQDDQDDQDDQDVIWLLSPSAPNILLSRNSA
jgi:hypothetical protein